MTEGGAADGLATARQAADGRAALGEGIVGHVEALNLTGLSFAVRRLLGKDARPVSNQFAMWARQDRVGLPTITRPLWDALAPLAVGRPPMTAAAVCEQVLRGRERDGDVALKAASDCAREGKERFRPLREPESGPDGAVDPDAEVLAHCQSLAGALKDWWRAVGTLYGEVRTPVAAGDLPSAVAVIDRARPALARVEAEIARLAEVLATHVVVPVQHPDLVPDEPERITQQATAGIAARPAEAPIASAAPVEVADPIERRAEAFAQQRRLHEEPEPEPVRRPVEVLSRRPVRDHVFLPIVFVLSIAALALFVIFSVLNAPNPLTTG
jgi:hypothetical protein